MLCICVCACDFIYVVHSIILISVHNLKKILVWVFGTVVKRLDKLQHHLLKCLGLNPNSASNSNFLVMCIQSDSGYKSSECTFATHVEYLECVLSSQFGSGSTQSSCRHLGNEPEHGYILLSLSIPLNKSKQTLKNKSNPLKDPS